MTEGIKLSYDRQHKMRGERGGSREGARKTGGPRTVRETEDGGRL